MLRPTIALLLCTATLTACAGQPPGPVPAPKRSVQQAVAAPADSDHDGVGNAQDVCPGTPHGMAVDARGCVVVDRVVLGGGVFEPGSAAFKPVAVDALRSVASALAADPAMVVEIRGHADGRGNPARNQTLSEDRARAVRDYLVAQGVGAHRLAVVGVGAAEPADSNETAQGRANNRRVTFRRMTSGRP